MISWLEWKRWTDSGPEELEYRLEEQMNSPAVRKFLDALGDYLNYARVLEISRHLDDPRRQQRTYCEALRDLAQKLADIKDKHEGEHYGISRNGGTRRRAVGA